MAQILPHLKQPIALFDNFITPSTEIIILRDRISSLTSAPITVRTSSGQAVLQIDKEPLSTRKTVSDMNGRPLFLIKKEHFSFIPTFKVQNGNGQTILNFSKSGNLGGTKCHAIFRSTSGQHQDLVIKADFWDKTAKIVDNQSGQIVASLDRGGIATRMFTREYTVSISPGMDISVIVAMCLCLDQIRNDRNSSAAASSGG